MRLLGYVAVIACVMINTAGCMVSKSKYDAAVSDMESAKAELERNRMVKDALEQQLQQLRSQNQKSAADLEMMASELQRIKESRANERSLLESREKELEKKTQIVASKMTDLQREYQKVVSQNRAMKDTIVRYQKELKEARKEQEAEAPPATASIPMQKTPPIDTIPAPVKPPAKPEAAPLAAPLKGALAPVNINTASANDLVLFLGLTKEVAEKVVANRPYRLRGELVAKDVVPKATFDVIKDRITASP